MRFNTLFFDLDGTLTDPGEGITASVAYALEKLGITPPPRSELCVFVGPPLVESFEKYFGLNRATSFAAVDFYRKYFCDRGIFENEIYPGIPEMLGRLKSAGARLVLATSKPEIFALRILEHFGINGYFDFVAGSLLDGTRIKKNEVKNYALTSLGITDRNRVAMIGDRENDISGAIASGVFPVGVLYGYGSRKELEAAEAGFIAGSVADLCDYLEK